MASQANTIRLALIGFGEVGQTFARDFIASGRHELTTYDILFDQPGAGDALRAKAVKAGVTPCASAAEAASRAQVVISAVTATSARDVADYAAEFLKPGQFFLDINSVSPETKQADEAAVRRSGASYVEAAVMAPVEPYGIKVPMLLGGAAGPAFVELMTPSGMDLKAISPVVGRASAMKMCRSIMIKGIESLAVECFLTARQYGVEDVVRDSLDETFPHMNWEKQAGYLITRVVQHGRRRAAEMRESAATIADTGLEPLMALATAQRQDWVADLVVDAPELKTRPQAEWRGIVDVLAAAGIAGLRKVAE